ncbi:MAG: tripartite tricarboxylate transporter substrate binding protein [Betaproteobacteria bacterium]|nr:tripartite tricarboxylate transporter substrate binding protein [Betaproteobacteria bacterium]MBI3052943.1 tripartite tricarboxylate transporter substrate binding protein [Betaproteobacteria bacterium]
MRIIFLTSLIAALVLAAGASAQPYPNRPVRFIVPYPAGGATDIISRLIGDKLGAALGQQFVIDNRAGGGQKIGTGLAAGAAPDGHTILLVSITHTINPSLYAKLPYDTIKDFSPITIVAKSPLVLVVHPSIRAKSVKELIALMKTQPGKLNCATSGIGSGGHLAAELFKSMAGVDMTFVPYRGGSLAYIDLIGGQVDLMFTSPAATLAYAKAGKLRVLATTGAKRSPATPELPTVAEATGIRGYEAGLWYGVVAPAGTPRAIVRLLNAEIVKALQFPDVRDPLAVQAVEVVSSTPEEFAMYIKSEIAKWAKVIKDANIHAN